MNKKIPEHDSEKINKLLVLALKLSDEDLKILSNSIISRLQSYPTKTKGNKYKCWYCGENGQMTKDHFYPKSKGGTLLVYCCHACNRAKGNKIPEQWVEYIKKQITNGSIPEKIGNRMIEATESLNSKIK